MIADDGLTGKSPVSHIICICGYRNNCFDMREINIALVAHDGRKKELLDWVKFNWKKLAKYNIWATGTTGRLISELVIEEDGNLIRPFEK